MTVSLLVPLLKRPLMVWIVVVPFNRLCHTDERSCQIRNLLLGQGLFVHYSCPAFQFGKNVIADFQHFCRFRISVHATQNAGHFGRLNGNTALSQFQNEPNLRLVQLVQSFLYLIHDFYTSLSVAKSFIGLVVIMITQNYVVVNTLISNFVVFFR
jgi:hypothetical protein